VLGFPDLIAHPRPKPSLGPIAARIGLMMDFVSAVTSAEKASAMTTATATSTRSRASGSS
jgi:hypothetical protein